MQPGEEIEAMKKTLIALLCAVLTATTAPAVLLPQGTSELALSGGVDLDSASGTQVDLNIFYGYFVQDYFQVGLKLGLYNDDDYTAWALGPRVEQNFDLGIELAPFVAGSLVFTTVDGPSGYGNKNALVFGVEGGLKYFITEYFALSSALVMELATDKIYPSDKDHKKYDIRLEFGVRTYF